MNARTVALGMILTAGAVINAKEPLSLRLTPAVSPAPADLRITTSLEPDAGNRSIEVIADATDFYRSSTIALEGDRAPRTMMLEFRSLPPGDYQISAIVTGADGRRRAIAQGHMKVVE